MALASETYDPFAQLIAEHQVVRTTTRTFVDEVQRYEGLIGSIPLDPAPVSKYATFLSEDVDQRHGAKEEKGLYPVLARYLPGQHNLLSPLRREHDELRVQQGLLAVSAARLASDPEGAETQRAVLQVAGTVQSLLTHQLDMEETNIFPLARGVLTQRDLAEVREAFLRFEQEFGTLRPPTDPESSRRGPALPPFCAAGRARRDRAERA